MSHVKKRQQKKKPRTRQQTPSLVPKPPPGPVVVKQKSRRQGISAKAKATINSLEQRLAKHETKAINVATGVGGAVGCTLASAAIVRKGWMEPKWTSLLMTTVGVGATYAGWRAEQPLVVWAGAGWTFAGASHGAMALIVEADRAAETRKAGQSSDTRNAIDATADNDIARRLRMSEERAEELEYELARARQRMNPEAELAAAA